MFIVGRDEKRNLVDLRSDTSKYMIRISEYTAVIDVVDDLRLVDYLLCQRVGSWLVSHLGRMARRH